MHALAQVGGASGVPKAQKQQLQQQQQQQQQQQHGKAMAKATASGRRASVGSAVGTAATASVAASRAAAAAAFRVGIVDYKAGPAELPVDPKENEDEIGKFERRLKENLALPDEERQYGWHDVDAGIDMPAIDDDE